MPVGLLRGMVPSVPTRIRCIPMSFVMDNTICRVTAITWKQKSQSARHLVGLLLREDEGPRLLVVPQRPGAEGAVVVEEAEGLAEMEDLAVALGPLGGA